MSDPRPRPTDLAKEGRAEGYPAARFLATALGIGLGLLGLFRLGWVERSLLLPYASAQKQVAGWLAGGRELPVVVDLSCTGADVIALCLASVLATPATWRTRLRGVAIGLLLVTALNTLRIGTLGLVAGDRRLFGLLHVYLWPAALLVAVALYVVFWMRHALADGSDASLTALSGARPARFVAWLSLSVALYAVVSPRYQASDWMEAATVWVAASGAALLTAFGATASASGALITTANGPFLVTASCVDTPLVAVYCAGALAWPSRWRRRIGWLAAAPAFFFALATLRLLTLAVPAALVGSPWTAIHAFNQLLVAVALAAAAAWWRSRADGEPAQRAIARLAAALAAGVAAAALGGAWRAAVAGTANALSRHPGPSLADEQGAVALLPAYQLALLAALWFALARRGERRPRRLLAAVALLAAAQIVTLLALGELARRTGFEAGVPLVRAWAVLAPVLLALLLGDPPRSAADGAAPAARAAVETA